MRDGGLKVNSNILYHVSLNPFELWRQNKETPNENQMATTYYLLTHHFQSIKVVKKVGASK